MLCISESGGVLPSCIPPCTATVQDLHRFEATNIRHASLLWTPVGRQVAQVAGRPPSVTFCKEVLIGDLP
jgi:hypothetical protein